MPDFQQNMSPIFAILAGFLRALAEGKMGERERGFEVDAAQQDFQRKMAFMMAQQGEMGKREMLMKETPQVTQPKPDDPMAMLKGLMGIAKDTGQPEMRVGAESPMGLLAQQGGIGQPLIGPMPEGQPRPRRIPVEQELTPRQKADMEVETHRRKGEISVRQAGKREQLVQQVRVKYKVKEPKGVNVQVWGAARKQAEGEAQAKGFNDYMATKTEGYIPFSSNEIPPVIVAVERVQEIYNEMMQKQGGQKPGTATPATPQTSGFGNLKDFVDWILAPKKKPVK